MRVHRFFTTHYDFIAQLAGFSLKNYFFFSGFGLETLEHASQNTLECKRWSTQAELAARLGTLPDVLQRDYIQLLENNMINDLWTSTTQG